MEGPVKRPLTPREVRLIEYFHGQDFFFRLGSWPPYLQDMILLPHKDNRQRFTLFFFLTGNGLDPDTAATWVKGLDVSKFNHGLIPGVYDDSAKRHFAQMIEQERAGTLFKGTKKMMDMTLGYVVLK